MQGQSGEVPRHLCVELLLQLQMVLQHPLRLRQQSPHQEHLHAYVLEVAQRTSPLPRERLVRKKSLEGQPSQLTLPARSQPTGHGQDRKAHKFGYQPEHKLKSDSDDEIGSDTNTLPIAFCNESKGGSTHCHACPESGCAQSGSVGAGVPHSEHEGHHPTSQSHCQTLYFSLTFSMMLAIERLTFSSNVYQEKSSTEQGDWMLHSPPGRVCNHCLLILSTVNRSGFAPKGQCTCNEFEYCCSCLVAVSYAVVVPVLSTHHDIVPRIPCQAGLCN